MANNHWGGGSRVINDYKFNKLAPQQPIPRARQIELMDGAKARLDERAERLLSDQMIRASLAKLNAAHEKATKP